MMQRSALKGFSLSIVLCLLLQPLILSSPAGAVPLSIEPFFTDPTVGQLLQQGRFGQVRDMAQAQLRETPDDAEIIAILAYAQAGLGDWDDARQSVVRAIQLAPEDRRDDLQVLQAEILLGTGDASEAEGVLQEVVGRDSTNTRALMGLGFLYTRTHDSARAADYFNRVLKIDPQHDNAVKGLLQVHMAQGDYAAVARVARQIPVGSPNKGLGYYFEALALIRQDGPDYGRAAGLLENALSVSRPAPEVLTTLGYVLLKEQRAQEAVGRLTQAVGLAPDIFDAQKLLGVALLEIGQPGRAARHLEQALAIKESGELRQVLSQAYLLQGRGEQGLAALMKSLEDTDQLTDNQAALQGLYQYTSGNFAQSEESLRQMLKKTPDAEYLRFLLISALLKQDRFEEAAREAQQALSTNPGQSVVLLNLLALARLGSGAFEDAEASLRLALADDPASVVTHSNLSTVYFRTGQYAKAVRELDAILANDPNDVETRVRLARVYQASNNYADAERVLQDAEGNIPSAGTLVRELILLKIRERDYDAALDYARAMTTTHPLLFDGYLFQAQALAALGRATDAVAALEAGFDAAGETQGSLAVAASLARVNGWHEMAVQYLQRHDTQFGLDDPRLRKLFATELIEVGRTDEAREVLSRDLVATNPDVLFLLAKSYVADGDRVHAEEYIDAALEAGVAADAIEAQRAELRTAIHIDELRNELRATPGEALRYAALAEAHESVGDFDAAISVYENGLGKTSADLSFQAQIARLLFKKGDSQQAIEVASRIVNSQEASTETRRQAYAVLGMSWVLQRETEKAEPALEQATANGSRLAPAFYELAKIKSAKGEIGAAIPLLRSAIDIEPDATSYYLALAALYQRLDNINEVIALYEDGISTNPGSVPLLNNLALVYMSQGETEKALSRALEALQLAPDNARVLDTLGRVYLLGRDRKQAIQYLQQAVDLEPASSLYRYHLGMVYFEAGSTDLAKAELEEALVRQTNAPWVPEIKKVLKEIGES